MSGRGEQEAPLERVEDELQAVEHTVYAAEDKLQGRHSLEMTCPLRPLVGSSGKG